MKIDLPSNNPTVIDQYNRYMTLYLQATKSTSEIAELASLQTSLADYLVTAADFNALATPSEIGVLSNSTTTDKSNLVNISNEINQRRKEIGYNVKDYGASASVQATTGSMTSGSNILTIAVAKDFVNGQGIYVAGNIEVASLVITSPSTVASNVTVTLDGANFTVAVASTDTAINVADKIRAYTYKDWTTGGTTGTTTVTFTSKVTGVKTDATYSAGTTGATGTMTTTTQGSADLITTITSGAGTTTLVLGANATATVSGVTVTHDDSQAIQALVNLITPTGGTIFFPAGHYNMASLVTVNYDLDQPQYSGKAISIKGDNANTTILVNLSPNNFIFNFNESFADGRATATYLHMENLTLTGTLSNKGITSVGISEQYFENLLFTNLFMGVDYRDGVRTTFVKCTFNQNKNGIYGWGQTTISTPNALDFFGCVFYGNSQSAAYFNQGCNLNFFGGTIETCGGERVNSVNTWGIKLNDCGRYGGAGASFFGTYFEGNGNVADVWINHTLYPATYSFHGCTFNKFAPPLDSPNNIRVDAGSQTGPVNAPAKVIVTGCSFRDMGNTPSSSTPYIQFFSGGAPVVLEQYGNYFQNQVELPQITTNRVYASARIVSLSTTPALNKGFNIDTIVRNSVGDYTINFIFPSAVAQKIYSFSMDIVGFTQAAIAETTTSVRVKCYNSSAVLADPGTLWLICTE